MWSKLNKPPNLDEFQAHVWKIEAHDIKEDISTYWELLSESEKTRAHKFAFEMDKIMFVKGRGGLRILLGYYLNTHPSVIEFSFNEYGKPFVGSEKELTFNVSQSHGLIVVGFTLKSEIGVDIEFNKRPLDIEDISKKFFSKQEYNDLLEIGKEDQLGAFYNCWTRKEALIKALGGGLSIPLDQFEVTLAVDVKPELKIMKWNQDDVKNWNIKSFDCDSDYTGAVIVHQTKTEYSFYEFEMINN